MNDPATDRADDRRAATVIVEVETDDGTLIALAATDPRWRLDREGRHGGTAALHEGGIGRLPITGLKFIGGLADAGESPLRAALREVFEEAGAAIGEAVAAAGPREVYRMTRALEWSQDAKVHVSYFHVRVDAMGRDLGDLFEPADDCLAIVLVRPDQVALREDGYAVTGPARATYWRKPYVPVPYETWRPSDAQRAAYDAFNAAGPADPFVGLDRDSLGALHVGLYCPPDASPTDALAEADLATGRPLPDGAILVHALGERAR